VPRTGAMTGAKLIGGDSSSGKSGDWQRIGGARTVPRTGAMTGAKLIGGDSSSGKSGDWHRIGGARTVPRTGAMTGAKLIGGDQLCDQLCARGAVLWQVRRLVGH